MGNLFEIAVRDEAVLRAALAQADIGPSLLTLVHLSGDMNILAEAAPHIKGAWNYLETIPEELKQKIRDRLVDVLKDYAERRADLPKLPSSANLQRMMSASVGVSVPEEYIPLLVEELRLGKADTRRLQWRRDPATLHLDDFKVVVIGAGFGGICTGIRLKQAGVPFQILERNPDVGGVWLENTYPGCGIDTPSHFYSLSFDTNPEWSRHFATRDELYDYIQKTVDKYDLRRHISFGTEVSGAEFDESAGVWRVKYRSADGSDHEIRCNALISAVGHSAPAMPSIEGLDKFSGPRVHTARWAENIDLKGKRVAMIGTGASGMQTGPTIVDDVAQLTVFQRTPHWVITNQNYHKPINDGQKWALRHIPLFSEWQRFQYFWAVSDGFYGTLHVDPNWHMPDISLNQDNHKMRENIIAYMAKELDGDEELLAKCTPSYPPYGKRLVRDNHWFKMLKRPNVELVADQISHITENGIVTKDGKLHEADVLILATGFQATRLLWPMDIKGRDGLALRAVWGDDNPRAYVGITVPGFPNLFIISGPNTSLSHGGSTVFHIECQVAYITRALREMVERKISTMEVRRDVHDRYNQLVDEKHKTMVWAHPGVKSWYKNKKNRVVMSSPWRLVDYWRLTHKVNLEDFVCDGQAEKRIGSQPEAAGNDGSSPASTDTAL